MEIIPATVAQVARMDSGRLVAVDDDVQNVARDLREIDPGLRLRFDEYQEFYVVYHVDGDEESLVTTAQECDQRLVKRAREISRPDYDYGLELEKAEAESKKQADDRFADQTGDVGERLAHALRKDLGLTGRAFIGGTDGPDVQ